MSNKTRRLITLLSAALAAALLVIGVSSPAAAHRNDESYLYLDVGDSTLSGTVQMPYRDVREVLGLRLAGSAEEVRSEIEAELETLQAYALEHTAIGVDGERWTISFDGYDVLTDGDVASDGLGYVILPYEVAITTTEVPQVLEVEFSPMLAEIEGRNNVILVANDWKRGVIEEESNELLVVDVDTPGGTIDLGDASQWKNFRTSIDLGVDHIRTGPDHIFFVFVLLLPSVLVLLAGVWRPAPSFGGSLLRVVLVATMFTIAHSITFTLAGLDLLPLPPSKLVETLIALSIGAAALHNIWPVFGHREWILAFVFGLFHGMGFAGLVADLDINRSTQLVSLLGRNVGIEFGQLVIILITFPGLFLLRRTKVYMPLFYVASAGLAILSGMWVVERIFEVDLGINDYVDKALLWPRSLYVAIAFTVVAAIIRQIAASRDELLDTGVPGSGEADGSNEDEPEPSLV